VIQEIQARDPGVVVCVVTCPPVNHGYAVMAPHVVAFNERLKAIAAELGCPLIDLHAKLVGPDGLLPPRLTGDGLHFKDAGYAILGAEIERVVAESEREPAPEPTPEVEPDETSACPCEGACCCPTPEEVRARMRGMLGTLRRRLGF